MKKQSVVKQKQANMSVMREVPFQKPNSYKQQHENLKKAKEIQNVVKAANFTSFYREERGGKNGAKQRVNFSFEGVTIKKKNIESNCRDQPTNSRKESQSTNIRTSEFVLDGLKRCQFDEYLDQYQRSLENESESNTYRFHLLEQLMHLAKSGQL